MVNQAVALALFSLTGVVIGAGLQFLFGSALESRKQLSLQRGQSYADYFKAVALAAHSGRSKDTFSLAADAKTRICIYGSTNVINGLHFFVRAGENTASPESRTAVIKLLRSMRADIGRDNRALDVEVVHDILFGSPEANEKPSNC